MSVPSREREQGPALSFENSRTRAYDGAIVTFVNEDGELRVVHRAGYSYEIWSGRKDSTDLGGKRVRHGFHFIDVIKALMEESDGWEGEWKVVTISTPASVYADITRPTDLLTKPPHYEASVLQKAGRIDKWSGTYANPLHERRRAHGLKPKGGRET